MAFTIDDAIPILKTLYPPEKIRHMAYKDNVLYAMMPKDTGFNGETTKEPIYVSPSVNRSADAATAFGGITAPNFQAFSLTRVRNYSGGALANEVLRAATGPNDGAFINALQVSFDSMLESQTRSQAIQMFRSGTGSVSTLSASAVVNSSSTPVALSIAADITNFEIGMNLAFSAADGGSLRAYTGTGAYIIDVDRIAGTLIFSGSVGGAAAALSSLVTGVSAGDYVYLSAGDALNGGTSLFAMSGLDAWIPMGSVTSTPFFGVNRLQDRARLAGVYFDGSAETIDEALWDAAIATHVNGGSPETCILNPFDFSKLVKTLMAKQIYNTATTTMKVDTGFDIPIAFSGVEIAAPYGKIKCFMDRNCPLGRAYLLQMDTWKFRSLGEPVSIFTGDGLEVIRDPSSDNLLFRACAYYQLSCRAPGFNAVVKVA